MDTALAWAVSAKNTFINNGFSSAQIGFGENCMFPSIINDNLSALESFNQSPNLAVHIATLYSARRAFIACESSEKIKRALWNNIRPSGQIYNIKDEVYYKRDNSPKWKAPAKVLGQDGPVVFLRHGTRHIKAHVCRVQPIENSMNEKNDKDQTPQTTPLANQPHNMSPIEAQSKLNTISHDDQTNSESEVSNSHQSENSFLPPSSQVPPSQLQLEIPSSSQLPPSQSQFQKSSLPQPSLLTKSSTLKSSIKLKTNQVISYNDHKGIKYRAKVLSRGGKSSGKYKNAYNIEYISPNEMNGTQSWINLDNISNLSVTTNNQMET